MKELSRKFSADDDDLPNPSGQSTQQPPGSNRPVCHDLHFVVKESLNLGVRFIDEFDRMMKKFREEQPEKKENDPS
ncbi:MAG: hypothetical protein HGA97_06310 [Chlorobiaceae bacterium]|jgi:hypothetical protein|nr:hypothetical protein [Chlorobiaceae bacterium]